LAQGKSERLVRYLEYCAQFHHYSFGNLILAWTQFPTMTRIAGIRQWNKLGRHVKQGEKGIMILAPMTVKRSRKKTDEVESEEGEEEQKRETITLFKPVYVFDVSQTEGKELPSLITAAGDATDCYPALEQAVRNARICLEYADSIPLCPGAQGVSLGKRIIILQGLESAEAFRALAHEFAHELLHKEGERESRTVRETEADAAAFVVCRHFGIHCDTADYLLLHDSNVKLLLERLETIRQTAAYIIDAIDAAHLEDEVEVVEGIP